MSANRHQAIGSVVVQYIEEDGAGSRQRRRRTRQQPLKNGAKSQWVPVDYRAPSALRAGNGNREAPQRTPPANICSVLLDDTES